MVNVDDIYQLIVENVVAFAPKLLLAIITIVVGFWIVKKLVNVIEKGLTKKKLMQV